MSTLWTRIRAALGMGDDAPHPAGRPIPAWRRALPSILGGLSETERAGEALGMAVREMRVGGRRRRLYVYRPETARPGAPLVLALHGGGGQALRFVHRIGAREMARDGGFVLIAPQGAGPWWAGRGSWNAESTVPKGMAETRGIDDIGFLDAVARGAAAEFGTSKAFVMGMSKGGMMAYRLACALPDRIDAIAVVAGTFSTDRCPDGAPVPLLHIHGSRDENVPLAGGRGRNSAAGASWPAVVKGIDLFRRANGCTGRPEETRPAPDVLCRTWRGPGGAEVQFCLVEGGGHDWPGAGAGGRAGRRAGARGAGRRGRAEPGEFHATRHIARFFRSH